MDRKAVRSIRLGAAEQALIATIRAQVGGTKSDAIRFALAETARRLPEAAEVRERPQPQKAA